MKEPSIAFYPNAFVAKYHNRRVECIKLADSRYEVRFIRFKKEQATKDELEYFDGHIKRCGGFILIKTVFLTEETMTMLSSGWVLWKKHKGEVSLNRSSL